MLQVHPIVASLSAVPDSSVEAIAEDIALHGQDWPIVLVQGMIWDGRARYEACERLGIKPWSVPLRRKHPAEFYVDANYARAGAPSSPERRALVAALFEVDTVAQRAATLERRRIWIREARAEFVDLVKGRREPCAVCRNYIQFVHAHHAFPLNLQFECGVEEPIHEYQWLCPIHHNRVHILLSGYLLGARDLGFLERIPDDYQDEWNAIERVAMIGIDLCCDALGQSDANPKPRGRYDPPYGLLIALNHQQFCRWPKAASSRSQTPPSGSPKYAALLPSGPHPP